MSPLFVSLTLLAIVVIAFLLGNYVSKSLRMPDAGWKVSLIIAVIGIAGLILKTSWPPKQGIDLKGGVILIYEVDEALTQQSVSPAEGDARSREDIGNVDMPGLIQALSRRINPGGVQEIVVRAYGDKQVEIIIPDVSSIEVERIKELITTGGFLKFQIVANRRDHAYIWSLADQAEQVGQYQVLDETGVVVGQWAKLVLEEGASIDAPIYRVDPPQAKSRIVRGRKEVLMVVDPNLNMQGSHLQSVRKGYQDVSPAVFFDTTVTGARLMDELTGNNLPDTTSGHYSLLGIVMDGDLISAPRINSRIGSSGVIEGQFTEEEVDLLVNVLRAGRLPAVLRTEPISQNEISPLLGSDTIRQGKVAIAISLVAVLVFMVVYYRFAGIVACLALLLNLTLILALMIFVGAAFSLPGMAALVLTVGMSVDANVLIFERIREETRHGAALRMAIRNGFGRASRTIVDANLTTLITAVVLYLIGTEQLRAFAVALILGILMTLFSAIFFSRVVFDLSEKIGGLKRLSMMQMFTDIGFDLFRHRHVAAGISLAAMLISLVTVVTRGEQIFDIDFRGGTSVQMLLSEPMEVATVRERVEQLRTDSGAQDVSVTEIRSEEHGNGRIYRVDASFADVDAVDDVGSAIDRVQQALVQEFSENGELLLQTHSLQFSPPTPIAAAIDAEDDLPEVGEVDGGAVDATEADTNQPSDADGTNVDRPSDTLLAWAPETLLAQAEIAQDPAGTTDAPVTAAESTDTSADALGTADVLDTADDVATPIVEIMDASNLKSESDLSFDEAMNTETLVGLIQRTALDLGMVQPDVVLSNTDPEWDDVSSKPYKSWTVRLSSSTEQASQLLGKLKADLDGEPVWLSANQIGSSVAGDKTRLAIAAVVVSLFGIIAYIWIRFQHVTYGLAAVAALIHDVIITLGAIALSYYLKDGLSFLMIDEFKISLPVVAAFLTIIGYSLNDTIVVFDRIREVKGKSPALTAEIISLSIKQTLSRTILTSLTTLIAVGILYAIGGQGIHAFAFALLIGVIVGTYSSIFVASPALLWMTKFGESPSAKPQKVTA